MITIRRSNDRGHAQHGWLDSRHTFSFADYFDAKHMGFRSLRVINDDRVEPGQGFSTHGHRDMEILTYVLEGALQHTDSMGSGSIIKPGEIQYMSAGSGVTHSEFNASRSEPVHLLQVWILPDVQGARPRYGQLDFRARRGPGANLLLASKDGDAGSLAIRQDARLFALFPGAGVPIEHALEPGRGAWLQVARGAIELNGTALGTGDGAAIDAEPLLEIESDGDAEALLFDLA